MIKPPRKPPPPGPQPPSRREQVIWNEASQPLLRKRNAPPPGLGISKDMALSVALQHAPPARNFRVFNAAHEGKPVYVVTFTTESGPFDIMVDAETGDIVER